MANMTYDLMNEAKAHLRIDATDEDLLIESLLGAAWEFVTNETGIDWASRVDTDGQPIDPPYLIQSAVLLLVGHYYANREATSPLTLTAIPMGVERIINQYRIVELL